MNKPHPTDRSWIDSVLSEIAAWYEGGGKTISVDEAESIINQKINEEFEELLKSLPEQQYYSDNSSMTYYYHNGRNTAIDEIRKLIKKHIKAKS